MKSGLYIAQPLSWCYPFSAYQRQISLKNYSDSMPPIPHLPNYLLTHQSTFPPHRTLKLLLVQKEPGNLKMQWRILSPSLPRILLVIITTDHV